ncbi:ankyrin [Aspergillus campestris IBT 28561]|uniref:Ankyrin n=1 Tax=Aspergillus campestris (strain IBT 28561) TaxID=1392248 RepID=A0A2I1DBF3_ASPC2|nr:ankyrin [Aspergillus campestris IBT 28561]PKY07206.1 ankyrin [Aspergillus campestris IBT 28561]
MDQSKWDLYKAEIRRIYMIERRTLKELRNFMVTTHGFQEKESQYHRKLKQWRFRKYRMGAKKWIYVKRQIEKRKKLNKTSEVFINGERCPPHVVRAEIRRQGFEPVVDIYKTAPSPGARDDVRVCTPGPLTLQVWPSDLPWFNFSQTALRDIAQNHFPQRESLSHSSLSALHEKDSYLELVSKKITTRLGSLLAGKAADCSYTSEGSSRMAAVLSTIMPEEHMGQNMNISDCLCRIRDEADLTGVIRIALFMMSNNFWLQATNASGNEIRTEDETVLRVFYLSGLYADQNIRSLLSMPGATAHAISLRLWASAVRTHNLEAVQSLLKAGINPDTPVLFNDDPVQPLEIATQSQNNAVALEMSCSLLSYNACSKDSQTLESALYHATEAGNKCLMELFLSKGAHVSGNTLKAAIHLNTPDLLETLLAADSDVNKRCDHEVCDKQYSVLGIAVKRNNVPLTRRLLSLGAKIDACQQVCFPNYTVENWQSTTLGLAAIEANDSMIDLLLTAGADVNHKTSESFYAPPLVLAVENGHKRLTERLLEAGADVALADATGGSTLVQRALAGDNQELSMVLEANGARVESKFIEDDYSSRLMQKVRDNDLETVRYLIGCGARVNDTHGGDTVLGAAVRQGNCEIVKILLRAGAVNIGEKLDRIGDVETAMHLKQRGMLSGILLSNGQQILVNAIRSDDSGLVQFLLDCGADQASDNIERRKNRFLEYDSPSTLGILTTPLEQATLKGELQLAETLVERGVSITDFELCEATRRCGHYGDFEFLNLFLHGLDGRACAAPNSYASALSASNSSFIVARLLNTGLDPRGKVIISTDNIIQRKRLSSMSVLDIGAMLGEKELFRSLLNFGNWDSQTKGQALAMCIDGECKDLVQELLDAGADVNHQVLIDASYVTPLVIAVQAQDVSMILSLLTAGADIGWTSPETSSGKDLTILQHAVSTGDKEIVEILLQAGADVNAPASRHLGKSALQCAAHGGNMELVDTLLMAGATINQEPAEAGGATALQFASILGYINIARKLLSEGAEVDAPRALYWGRTALEGAAEFGRIDMLQLLLTEGASVHGLARRQYIRAIKLAGSRTHYAAAKLLRDFGGWGEDDACQIEQEVFDLDEYERING